MNELITISTFVLMCIAIASATKLGYKTLYIISTFIIIVSNITVGIEILIFNIPVSLGVIIYSLIYLITDIISEISNEKNEAYKFAIVNLLIQILFWIYMFLSINTEPVSGLNNHHAMHTLFNTSARITIAAIIASLGSFLDIWFYEYLLSKNRKKGERKVKYLWLRNILSTFIGQSFNTAIFFAIALYGIVDDLLMVILSAIVIKWIIALLDTPFLYLARNLNVKERNI